MRIKVGSICFCGTKRLGIVTRITAHATQPTYYGVNLSTGGEWMSIRPSLVGAPGELVGMLDELVDGVLFEKGYS